MISAQRALAQLREGNQRFVEGTTAVQFDPALRSSLARGQQPMAIILSCADSRVPVERVFDQDLGKLFVIRVAGNIATPATVGSIEYAVAVCKTRLVVVLGHSCCGAVDAALEEIRTGTPPLSPNLEVITRTVRQALKKTVGDSADVDEALLRAVTSNVRSTVHHLQHHSKILRQASQSNDLTIVGAMYALETGVVTFLDE